jgi:hypothetical protein
MRLEFWERALEALRDAGLARWQNITPSKDHWITSSIGVSGCIIVLIFLRHEIRVEFQLNRPDRDENKWVFDQLAENKGRYEQTVGEEMEWRRIDDKKVSMMVCKTPVQGYSKENWPEMLAWLVDHYRRMDEAFSEPVRTLAARMKPGGGG